MKIYICCHIDENICLYIALLPILTGAWEFHQAAIQLMSLGRKGKIRCQQKNLLLKFNV